MLTLRGIHGIALHWWTKVLNANHSTRHKNLSLQVMAQGSPRGLLSVRLLPLSLVVFHSYVVSPYHWKCHTWATGHREIILKLPLCWVACLLPGGLPRLPGEKRHQCSYPALDPACCSNSLSRQDVHTALHLLQSD